MTVYKRLPLCNITLEDTQIHWRKMVVGTMGILEGNAPVSTYFPWQCEHHQRYAIISSTSFHQDQMIFSKDVNPVPPSTPVKHKSSSSSQVRSFLYHSQHTTTSSSRLHHRPVDTHRSLSNGNDLSTSSAQLYTLSVLLHELLQLRNRQSIYF